VGKDFGERKCTLCDREIQEFHVAEDFKANYKLLSLLTSQGNQGAGKSKMNEQLAHMVGCPKHPDKPVAYFCKACNTVVCVDCMFDSHNGHLLTNVLDMCKLSDSSL
jgi:hypothetical protein